MAQMPDKMPLGVIFSGRSKRIKAYDDEEAFAELHRLYNFADDDSRQFTRWQMLVAMHHGRTL
jgi:hypothetical protein